MTIREGELGHHTDLFEIAFNVQTEISSVQVCYLEFVCRSSWLNQISDHAVLPNTRTHNYGIRYILGTLEGYEKGKCCLQNGYVFFVGVLGIFYNML